jgi:ABC-2 type transport system permease protein
MIYTLFKHEIYTITSNKRYIASLGIQLLLLFAILPVFSTFLATGSVSIITPALNEFVPIGVVDESQNSFLLREALLQNKKIEVTILQKYDVNVLEKGSVAGVLLIPSDYDETLNKVLEVKLVTDASNMKVRVVYDAVFPSISAASGQLTLKRREEFGVTIEDPLVVKKELLKPLIIEEGQKKFSSFFLSYLVPLMLFFPIFTVGSIILDSVVGERERKTIESLFVTPLRRGDVLVSKFLSASFFVAFQIILWLMIFYIYGFPIQNSSTVFIMVLIIDSAIISTALLFAYYSRTVKEANILLMLLYTTLFVGLIVSLSINFFDTSLFSTPFTIISDLVVGENPGMIFWSSMILLYTVVVLAANIRLVERDDIVFGPRPSVFELFSDLSLWLFESGRAGYVYLPLVFGIFAILYATMIEVVVGIFIVFSFGFTNLLVPIFALIEEVVKPVGLYLLAGKREVNKKEAVAIGMLSGIMFFALESLIFAAATYYLFPERLLSILELRISTTMVVHAITSGIVGYGIFKKDNFIFFLLIATLIHSVFNLVVTGGGL